MSGGKNRKLRIKIVERRQRALSYRKAGASYRSIAAQVAIDLNCSYSLGQAYRDVSEALSELSSNARLEAESLRELELARLDTATEAIASKVQKGDLLAIDRWLRISESRRRLLGLDAPIQIQVEERVEAELEQFLAQLESALPVQTFQQVLEAVATIGGRAAVAEQN